MARSPKKPTKVKQPKPEPITLETAKPFKSSTTYLPSSNSRNIPFPRIRTVMINDKLSLWTPHLKEYVLNCVRQGLSGQDGIDEWMRHGSGATPNQYLATHLKPNPFDAMQHIPGYRQEYREACHANQLRMEEELLTGSMINNTIRTYESYGSILIDPSSVRLAKLKTETAIRCLQSLDRQTWNLARHEEKRQDEQARYQIYVPKREG